MKKLPAFFLCVTTVCVLASADSVQADGYMDSSRLEFFRQVQEDLFNDRYAEADSAYAVYIERHPGDPAGYLFRAAGLMGRMSDMEENAYPERFHRLLEIADSLSGEILDTCGDRTAAWMHLFRGHAQAYRSLWESRFGSFLSAIRSGFAANGQYEKGLKRDSTLTDLYAGIGSYHYWKSAKAGLLRLVGVFKNEKDKGISELRRAAAGSILHCELARSALIWIWLDKQQYDSAIALASEFIEKYPEGRTFLWPKAQALFRRGSYEEAARVYQELRSKLKYSPGNYYNLVEADYFLTQCYNWMRQNERAGQAASRLRRYHDDIPETTLRRQSSRINFLKRMMER